MDFDRIITLYKLTRKLCIIQLLVFLSSTQNSQARCPNDYMAVTSTQNSQARCPNDYMDVTI
jgi:hypothetical protein